MRQQRDREEPSCAITPDSGPFVQLRGVEKRFGAFMAVHDISFSVQRGEFLTLLGPSGSGKSTILRMIAGFIPPDRGEIIVNHRSISQMPPHRRSIGVVFQSLALFPHMTVADNVAYPLKCRRYNRRDIPDRVEKYLRIVQLEGLGRRRIGDLSGGQRQRVAIARALVFEPDLLLLDEPLAALDKKLREDVQMELRRIQSDLGVTTLNVTHDQREALVMSDNVMVLSGGQLQQFGSPGVIYREPANGFVASFIGQTNVFACALSAASETFLRMSSAAAREQPLPALTELGGGECALRAEHIRIGPEAATLTDVDLSLPAQVGSVAYEGDRVLYEIEVSALRPRLRIIDNEPIRPFAIGARVRIGWRLADMIDLNPAATHRP